MSMPPEGPLEDQDGPMPPDVRFVKRLVVILTSVMIAGLVLIVGLLVARFDRATGALSHRIALP